MKQKSNAKWLMDGFPEYYIGTDKILYKLSNHRPIKLCMVNASKGYYLNRKFYTLSALRKRIKPAPTTT